MFRDLLAPNQYDIHMKRAKVGKAILEAKSSNDETTYYLPDSLANTTLLTCNDISTVVRSYNEADDIHIPSEKAVRMELSKKMDFSGFLVLDPFDNPITDLPQSFIDNWIGACHFQVNYECDNCEVVTLSQFMLPVNRCCQISISCIKTPYEKNDDLPIANSDQRFIIFRKTGELTVLPDAHFNQYNTSPEMGVIEVNITTGGMVQIQVLNTSIHHVASGEIKLLASVQPEK